MSQMRSGQSGSVQTVDTSYKQLHKTKMAIFKGIQIAADFGYNLGFKKKLEMRKKIVENGGIISFIVTKKCHFVVTSDPEKCQLSTKCRMASKYGLPVLNLDYIWDCLQAEKLLPTESYIVGGKSKFLDFKSGKISALNPPEKSKSFASKAPFNPKSVKIWHHGDESQPYFEEESYEVAKFCIFLGYNKLSKSEVAHIVELHSSILLSKKTSVENMEEENDKGPSLYRIVYQQGNMKDLEKGNICNTEFRYVPTAEQALACFSMLYEELKKKPDLTKQVGPIRGVGSLKLQRLMAQSSQLNVGCSADVKELVEHIWQEAMSEITTLLGELSSIRLEQVEKAEAILVKIREAMKVSASDSKIQSLISEFYSILKHRNENTDIKESERKKWCVQKQDMCQLVKDMISASEMTNFQERSFTDAKYAALRCQIRQLANSERQDVEDLIRSSMDSPNQDLLISNVFEVWRQVEDIDFRFDIEPKRLLFHSSKIENFVGILSRGLLLPKAVVDDMGGSRTDEGSLGCGIYFASDFNTSVQYSTPSKTKGSRLLLINEVALGQIKDYTTHETSLVAPPPGYNSTHGVSKKCDKSSLFEHDEYVVYTVNQQRVRYLVEFMVAGDQVKSMPKTTEIDSNLLCDDLENTTLNDVIGVSDPLLKVVPGLVGNKNAQVELRGVHIRAKLIDLAAQVVVLQEYYNNTGESIEAKYVFPLDDAAAVCGFEAFINGKHIVGEVKEKEVAHKEYKEAISQGHGAYLMDQDEETPDVFTVSVGNLPPSACVLIKITYVAELQVEDELISFILPATVAPWKEDSALKYSTQEELKSHKMAAANTTVQVALEMPFEIRSLHCPTHKVKIKQTSTKAYVEMSRRQNFGSGFQLLIGLAEIHVPRMWVERLPESQDQACMLTFFPEFEAQESTEGEIIILLDVSNSMKDKALNEAKKVALLILKSLQPNWHFNIVKFGSDYEELFPAPKLKTQENLELADHFIQISMATCGNTDVIRPLWPLYLLPNQKTQRNVCLISDGHLNNNDLVMKHARANSLHTRIFTFGVSATCNNYALKALARVSGGAFEFFNIKTKSKWESKVKTQLNKASQPGLTSVSVEWRQYNDNLPPPIQAPHQITALFNGSRQVIYGFVPNCTMATLSANVGGQQASTVVSTSELSITEGNLVHRLTARAVIRDWEDGMLSSDRTGHEIAKMDQKNGIIELSKQFSIVTQFTSFIAVEKREENEKDVLPTGPSIKDLLNKENVDILPYMGWTKGLTGDDLSLELMLQQLGEDINNGSLSNKTISQLEAMEEKLEMMKEKTGACNKDVIQNAKLLVKAYTLQSETSKAVDLAVEIFNAGVDELTNVVENADVYPKVITYLHELRTEALKIPEVEHRLKPISSLPVHDGRFLIVKNLTGKSVSCPASDSMTVLDLKHILLEKEGVPLEQQRLIYKGCNLEDNAVIGESGLNFGDCIHLVLKLRGGLAEDQETEKQKDEVEVDTDEFGEDCFLKGSFSTSSMSDSSPNKEDMLGGSFGLRGWGSSFKIIDEADVYADGSVDDATSSKSASMIWMSDSSPKLSLEKEVIPCSLSLSSLSKSSEIIDEMEVDADESEEKSISPKFSAMKKRMSRRPRYSRRGGSGDMDMGSQLLISEEAIERADQERESQKSSFTRSLLGKASSKTAETLGSPQLLSRKSLIKESFKGHPGDYDLSMPSMITDPTSNSSISLDLEKSLEHCYSSKQKPASKLLKSTFPLPKAIQKSKTMDAVDVYEAPPLSKVFGSVKMSNTIQGSPLGTGSLFSDTLGSKFWGAAPPPTMLVSTGSSSGVFGFGAGDEVPPASCVAHSVSRSPFNLTPSQGAAPLPSASFGTGYSSNLFGSVPSLPSHAVGSSTKCAVPPPPPPCDVPIPLSSSLQVQPVALIIDHKREEDALPHIPPPLFSMRRKPLSTTKSLLHSPPQSESPGEHTQLSNQSLQRSNITFLFAEKCKAPPVLKPSSSKHSKSASVDRILSSADIRIGCVELSEPVQLDVSRSDVSSVSARAESQQYQGLEMPIMPSCEGISSPRAFSLPARHVFKSHYQLQPESIQPLPFNDTKSVVLKNSAVYSKRAETLMAREVQDSYCHDIEMGDNLLFDFNEQLDMYEDKTLPMSSEDYKAIEGSQPIRSKHLFDLGIGTDVTNVRCTYRKLDRETLIRLMSCQAVDGSWQFGMTLDQLLGINSGQCQHILIQSGLKSLGSTAEQNIQKYLATLLVLISLYELVEPVLDLEVLLKLRLSNIVSFLENNEETFRSLGLTSEEMSRTTSAINKAFRFCQSMDTMYPIACSTLELGPSWYHVVFTMMKY
ncbi:protein mono-ADP-ribosyltransferase PARP4-like isoform X2 [Biomphalaria glabrata]|uniref:Poly [ADP-ribose] polymerase n=1 Tax=Biomphalaria glabrata TaxID=6526 RepID=A0A9W3AL46_BIOGL|nr:protein mono-ADP-ribosyltransferase PARP4-like isoform X2 [Biomphalaria glabrata]